MTTQTIQIEAIVKRLPELNIAWRKKFEAGQEFKEICKAVGQSAHVDKSVIASYVNASFGKNREKHKRNAQQLSLLFDEIPKG